MWNVKEGDSVHIWRCRFSEECKVRAWRPKAWQIEVTSWFFEHGSYISWFTAEKTRATHVYLIERLSFHGNICIFPRINVVVNVTNDIFFVLNYSLKYSLLYWLCSLRSVWEICNMLFYALANWTKTLSPINNYFIIHVHHTLDYHKETS